MQQTKRKAAIAIGIIEILIGAVTLLGVVAAQYGLAGSGQKPFNVLCFVIFSAIVAVFCGTGVVLNKKWARSLLIYFSGYVLLTKILIYSRLMTFAGPRVGIFPEGLKDSTSFIYHIIVIILLARDGTRDDE